MATGLSRAQRRNTGLIDGQAAIERPPDDRAAKWAGKWGGNREVRALLPAGDFVHSVPLPLRRLRAAHRQPSRIDSRQEPDSAVPPLIVRLFDNSLRGRTYRQPLLRYLEASARKEFHAHK